MNDLDRIAAEGVPLTLSDGRAVCLRYTMRSLKMLEDSFGSLAAINDAVNGQGQQVGPLMTLLAAGLISEGITEDQLLDLTSTKDMERYGETISQAFAQAFPEATEQAGKAPEDSPGPSGTTSPPSPSTVTSVASG